MRKHTILCVDDEIDNVEALERLFRKKFEVLTATSPQKALELLESTPEISLIISDQRMPKITGVELLEASMKWHPNAIRMLLTGYTDIDSVIAAINAGQVYRYVTKPWDPLDLSTAVEQGIEKYELVEELKRKNRDLEKAFAELKTLDQAKDHFMILINHELKTPLTAILSFLELLQDGPLNSDQMRYIDRITKNSLRLKSLINDVLIIMEAETRRRPLHKENFVLSQSFKEPNDSFVDLAKGKNQKFDISFDKHKVHADKNVVKEVLHRLTHNALKFGNPDSHIKIYSKELKKDKKIQVTVENEGKPIPPETVHKILQPFSLDEDIMKHSTGLGLGLSLCQSLLKHHESELDFSSQDGHIQVSFSLPSTP